MLARILVVCLTLLAIGGLTAAQAQDNGREDGAVRLTTPPGSASDQNPAYSPDGTLMIFTRFAEGYNDGPSEVLLLDYTSGQTAVILSEADTDNVNMPGASWSPIAERITFASDRQDTDEIWTSTMDGGNPTRVTVTRGGYASEPTFSLDGEWIAFEVVNTEGVPEDEQKGAIWIVQADGSAVTQLTGGVEYDDRQPNWSPLEDLILFQRRVPGTDNWDLYTISADGQDLRQITTSEGSDTDASWSPDGAWLVYSSDFGGLEFANLFVISAYGGSPIRVTENSSAYDGAPSWSPDFKWIAFESGPEDEPTSLWAIAAPASPGRAGGTLPEITVAEG
jgi:TolB protein